mgnify:CR=1 FL=1
MRDVEIIRNFTKYAAGSVLYKQGNTWVLCTASVEEKVPPFKRDSGDIINYVVADWEDNEMPDLRFDYPSHTYLLESIPAAGESSPSQASKEAQMSETVPFRGYFQMTYPANHNWTPTLIGRNASQCTVRVYDYAGNTEVPRSAWPIQASEDWYMIEVSPAPGHMQPGALPTCS